MIIHEPVSIVMCTYNGATYLQEQLDTILQQSYSNFELIISDDNSKDETWDLLEKNALLDKRIKLFKNEVNIGYNKNFEKAIKAASYQYICIADQDDIWIPQKVEKLLGLVLKENIVLAYHNIDHFTSTANFSKTINTRINIISGDDPSYNIFQNSISGHTILFNKKILDNEVSFPTNIYYDWWLSVLALTKGSIAGTQEILSYHRIHNNNASAKKGNNKFLSESERQEKLIAYQYFLTMKGIKEVNIKILKRLIFFYSDLKHFNFSLFAFLIANNKKFFYYKKGGFLYFNRIKACYRMSKII